MPRASTLDALADVAEEQWGLFTRRQAEATGIAWSTLSRLAGSGVAERIAHGVYRLRGAPRADHLELRTAWLQLAPNVRAWERDTTDGVVSHRSAAAFYGLGDLPADVHEFTFPARRQSRRPDVRLRRGHLGPDDWIRFRGLLVTRPARTAADLLAEHEDPGAVAQVIVDSLRAGLDTPGRITAAIAPYVKRFPATVDGLALFAWLLDLATTSQAERHKWITEAHDELVHEATNDGDNAGTAP